MNSNILGMRVFSFQVRSWTVSCCCSLVSWNIVKSWSPCWFSSLRNFLLTYPRGNRFLMWLFWESIAWGWVFCLDSIVSYQDFMVFWCVLKAWRIWSFLWCFSWGFPQKVGSWWCLWGHPYWLIPDWCFKSYPNAIKPFKPYVFFQPCTYHWNP